VTARYCVLLLCAGCFGNTTSAFPPGLEPLEDNTAAGQDGEYTETLAFEEGEDDYIWVHARGYVLAPPGDAWAALHDAELMASCATDSHSFDVEDDPAYELSFVYHYVVEQVLTIAWDEQWRYGTIAGTQAAPELAIVRYQKVFGSELISLIEGSIQVLATDDPEVAELQWIEHLSALGGGSADMRASMQHRFEAIAAVARDDEPPPCP